jgi:hypothetical protein
MESPSRPQILHANVVIAATVLIHESDSTGAASAACVLALTLVCVEALVVNQSHVPERH